MGHFRLGLRLLRHRIREYLIFDSRLFAGLVTLTGTSAALILKVLGRRMTAISSLGALHRGQYSAIVDRMAERLVRREISQADRWRHTVAAYVEEIQPNDVTAQFFERPARLLGTRILVLKSPRRNERGVIVMDYTALFPVVAKLFDLEEIGRRYRIVLEPAWSGYCDPAILSSTIYQYPAFVEAYEPRDARFINSLAPYFVSIPLSSNWWVDHRVFRPIAAVQKEVDLIMVAGWAWFKRHASFFAALRRLKRRGHHLHVSLLGYPNGLTQDDIMATAKYFSIEDQIEIHEWLSPEDVNVQFNRAKVNVIWSRREGVNRAMIEGMFAGVPCIVREGFNYGYRYPYVNENTGAFSSENDLPDRILGLLARYKQMRPRDWVRAHMSPERSNQILSDAIRAHATAAGEDWTSDLAVRVKHLSRLDYWDASDRTRFADDYVFLASEIRHGYASS